MSTTLIQNAKVVLSHGIHDADVVINGELIEQIIEQHHRTHIKE